jgi:preprotein translocase subunit SecB
MSEQPSNGQDQSNGKDQAAPANMPITILMQYIKDLSFENPNAPQSLLPSEGKTHSDYTVDVDAKQIADNVFEVELKIHAEAGQDEHVAFIVELSYAGVFQLGEVAPEHQAPMLLIEGARLLFPFARSIVANATRDGGFLPFLLPAVDFVEVFRRRVARAEAEQAAQVQTKQ